MKNVTDTQLARCLNTLDLTALGEFSNPTTSRTLPPIIYYIFDYVPYIFTRLLYKSTCELVAIAADLDPHLFEKHRIFGKTQHTVQLNGMSDTV